MPSSEVILLFCLLINLGIIMNREEELKKLNYRRRGLGAKKCPKSDKIIKYAVFEMVQNSAPSQNVKHIEENRGRFLLIFVI